jgi:hypothetical protein
MLQKLIQLVMRMLLGITKEQWLTAVKWVGDAATYDTKDGTARGTLVRQWLKGQWPEMKSRAVNALAELAYNFFRSKA